jgi:3'(2'), 5'-bisphosphate nucleotidase
MKITQAFIDSIYEALEEIVIDASNAIIEVYKSESFNTKIKSDGSPVTEADNRANDVITKALNKITPEIPVISEETYSPKDPNLNIPYWLIDPLDGTKGFINKDGNFTVNIALIENGKPLFGIIRAPVTGITWSGSFFDNPVMSEDQEGPLRIVMSKNHQTEVDKNFLDHLSEKSISYSLVEKGSSLKLCALADNEADIYPRFGPTSEWDIAAGHACLKSKGGSVCQMLSGNPLAYTKDKSILNPAFVGFRNTYLKNQYLGLISEFYKKLV